MCSLPDRAIFRLPIFPQFGIRKLFNSSRSLEWIPVSQHNNHIYLFGLIRFNLHVDSICSPNSNPADSDNNPIYGICEEVVRELQTNERAFYNTSISSSVIACVYESAVPRLVTAISWVNPPPKLGMRQFFCHQLCYVMQLRELFTAFVLCTGPGVTSARIENMSFLSRADIKLPRNFVSP